MPLSPFKSIQTNRRSPQQHEALAHAGGFAQFSPHQKTALLDGEPKQCYNQGIAAGFYRFLALLIGTIMIAVMVVHFLLQVIQRFAHHICDDANAGYHKQKVRHAYSASVGVMRWYWNRELHWSIVIRYSPRPKSIPLVGWFTGQVNGRVMKRGRVFHQERLRCIVPPNLWSLPISVTTIGNRKRRKRHTMRKRISCVCL